MSYAIPNALEELRRELHGIREALEFIIADKKEVKEQTEKRITHLNQELNYYKQREDEMQQTKKIGE